MPHWKKPKLSNLNNSKGKQSYKHLTMIYIHPKRKKGTKFNLFGNLSKRKRKDRQLKIIVIEEAT